MFFLSRHYRHPGFGLRLVERIVTLQGARLVIEWSPNGLPEDAYD